jgi:hypothetical protein
MLGKIGLENMAPVLGLESMIGDMIGEYDRKK